jgi:glucose-6-phosphate isomerase
MNKTDFPLLSYHPAGTMIPLTGLSPDDLPWLAPRLEAARDEMFKDVALWHSHGAVPQNKSPLDAGFIDMPHRLLEEYRKQDAQSEVGRILATAKRIGEQVDRVVVLGIGGSYMGARALFEACCHPYHNELSREDRNGRPRVYFEGNNVDNSTVAALQDMLARNAKERWAIVVISKSGGTLETAVAFRLFLRQLRDACKDQPELLPELVVPVTGGKGRLRDLANRLKCREVFPIPDGVGGRFSILSAVGLLPAAILGLDIVKLLEGAVAITEHCRTAPVGKNPVLDFVGVGRLMEVRRGATIRILSTWGKRLEAVGLWYDQLLAESLGKDLQGAMPLTVVNTRDLHSRGQQHQEGRRDKLITNLIVDASAVAHPIAVGSSDLDDDKLNELADKTLPDILQAAFLGTNRAYREDQRPTADLRLPRIDEATLGQLFQMLMLATVIEGRLIGVNPYGQPGVEAYKKNMNAILRGK